MDELIIAVAPHQGESVSADFPDGFSVTDEIIRCYSAGAAVVHLHPLDPSGVQVADNRWLAQNVRAVHAAVPIIVEGSTGSLGDSTPAERSVALDVPGVEMGSLNAGSINMAGRVFLNPYPDICYYASAMQRRGIKPTIMCFDLSHFVNAARLIADGLITPPYAFGFVFGVPDTLPYADRYIEHFLNEMPPGAHLWFLVRHFSRGAQDFIKALESGGHVRLGFEDSFLLSDGRRARSNAELVEEMVRLAELVGRKVVGSARAREIMGLDWRHQD